MGAVLYVPPHITDDNFYRDILEAVRAHGVIVLRRRRRPTESQPWWTRAEQIAFTSRLGDLVIVPSPPDPECTQQHSINDDSSSSCHPAIQRNSNFFLHNNTWKGPHYRRVGAYWHQDGQFWQDPSIVSVLYGQSVPREGGETAFVDMRAVRRWMEEPHNNNTPLLLRAANATIVVNVRAIADFQKWKPADLDRFPVATHAVLTQHASDGGPLVYVGSPFSHVAGVLGSSPEAAGREWLRELYGVLEDAEKRSGRPEHRATLGEGEEKTPTAASHHQSAHDDNDAFNNFFYYHKWQVGDILVWDNTQTLHKSMPYNNADGTERRELYRTQARFSVPSQDDGAGDEL